MTDSAGDPYATDTFESDAAAAPTTTTTTTTNGSHTPRETVYVIKSASNTPRVATGVKTPPTQTQTSTLTSPTVASVSAHSATAKHAIASIESALISAQHRIDEQAQDIANLHASIRTYELKLSEAHDLLQQTYEQSNVKERALKEAIRAREEMNRALQMEQAAFAKLKSDAAHQSSRLTELENQHLLLIQRHGEDRVLRDELQSTVVSLQNEIQTLQIEKTKYKNVFKELETKLRLELDSFELERTQWKEKSMHFIHRQQTDEQIIRNSKRKAAELAASVVKLSDANVELEQQLAYQQRQHAEMMGEYRGNEDEAVRLRAELAALKQESKDKEENYHKTSIQLKQTSEQLRQMAEKVFTLMNELTKMDEFKASILSEQKESHSTISALKSRNESLSKQNDALKRSKEKLEETLKLTEERLSKQRHDALEMKSRWMNADKAKMVLERQLKQKEQTITQIASKTEFMATRLQSEQVARNTEKKILSHMEVNVSSMEDTLNALREENSELQQNRHHMEQEILELQSQITRFNTRQDYYDRLQAAIARTGGIVDDHGTLILPKGDDVMTPRTITNQYQQQQQAKIRLALQSRLGQKVTSTLERLELGTEMLNEWIIHPQRMIDGLHSVIKAIKTNQKVENALTNSKSAAMNASSSLDASTLALHQARQQQLSLRLSASEDHKTKAMMRWMSWLTHTDVILQLAELGLEDRDMEMIASTIATNTYIQEMDIRGNRIGNQGMLACVKAALEPTSVITLIDLQQNHVTMDGLEQLASLLVTVSRDQGQSQQQQQQQQTHQQSQEQVQQQAPSQEQQQQSQEQQQEQQQTQPEQQQESTTSGDEQQAIVNGTEIKTATPMSHRQSIDDTYVTQTVSPTQPETNVQTQPETVASSEQQSQSVTNETTSPSHSPDTSTSHCTIISCDLRREGKTLLPIVEIHLPHKTIVIDLRYNRLQHSDRYRSPTSTELSKPLMKRLLTRVTRMLHACSRPSHEYVDTTFEPIQDESHNNNHQHVENGSRPTSAPHSNRPLPPVTAWQQPAADVTSPSSAQLAPLTPSKSARKQVSIAEHVSVAPIVQPTRTKTLAASKSQPALHTTSAKSLAPIIRPTYTYTMTAERAHHKPSHATRTKPSAKSLAKNAEISAVYGSPLTLPGQKKKKKSSQQPTRAEIAALAYHQQTYGTQDEHPSYLHWDEKMDGADHYHRARLLHAQHYYENGYDENGNTNDGVDPYTAVAGGAIEYNYDEQQQQSSSEQQDTSINNDSYGTDTDFVNDTNDPYANDTFTETTTDTMNGDENGMNEEMNTTAVA